VVSADGVTLRVWRGRITATHVELFDCDGPDASEDRATVVNAPYDVSMRASARAIPQTIPPECPRVVLSWDGRLARVLDVTPAPPAVKPAGVDYTSIDDLWIEGEHAVGKVVRIPMATQPLEPGPCEVGVHPCPVRELARTGALEVLPCIALGGEWIAETDGDARLRREELARLDAHPTQPERIDLSVHYAKSLTSKVAEFRAAPVKDDWTACRDVTLKLVSTQSPGQFAAELVDVATIGAHGAAGFELRAYR